MSRRVETIPAEHFDALYTETADPWAFRTSDYEQAKYARTLAALTRPRYGDALEVGCSIGVFTRSLAERCDRLLAVDASAVALATARETCADRTSVTFERRMVPADFPGGEFDLIVLSEVLYYLTMDDLARLAARCFEAQPGGGEIVLCHWLGVTDYPLTGEAAAEGFCAAARSHGYRPAALHAETYRLDRLLRP